MSTEDTRTAPEKIAAALALLADAKGSLFLLDFEAAVTEACAQDPEGHEVLLLAGTIARDGHLTAVERVWGRGDAKGTAKT